MGGLVSNICLYIMFYVQGIHSFIHSSTHLYTHIHTRTHIYYTYCSLYSLYYLHFRYGNHLVSDPNGRGNEALKSEMGLPWWHSG